MCTSLLLFENRNSARMLTATYYRKCNFSDILLALHFRHGLYRSALTTFTGTEVPGTAQHSARRTQLVAEVRNGAGDRNGLNQAKPEHDRSSSFFNGDQILLLTGTGVATSLTRGLPQARVAPSAERTWQEHFFLLTVISVFF